MDTIKKTLNYWKKLRNNELDHGDIFAYSLIPIMSKFLLWWTDEDYKTVKSWKKVLYMLLSIRITTSMILSLWYIGMHWERKPIEKALEDAAIALAAIVGSCGTIIFPYNRKRTSHLLRTINEVNVDILQRGHNALNNRRTSNRLFMAITILSAALQVSGIMSYNLFAWEFANSGVPKFNSFLCQPEPFSVMAFVDETLFLMTGFWMMSLTNSYSSMYIDFILRISFHFQVTAEEMRQLRRGLDFDEENELHKLKSLVKDSNLLFWCVDEFNGTIRVYAIIWFWLAFSTLGVYATLILYMDSFVKSLQLLLFPIYFSVYAISFCAIGQHLKDSADEIQVGIYDCDWYSAPIPFRKRVLNVLTRCTHETLFRADPFYDVDLLLLTRVLKSSYSMIALFRNFF